MTDLKVISLVFTLVTNGSGSLVLELHYVIVIWSQHFCDS